MLDIDNEGKLFLNYGEAPPSKIVGEPAEWPGGISDGLNLPCKICDKRVTFDFQVNDDAWLRIVPEGDRQDVICLSCLDSLAVEKGLDISESLKSVQFTGINKTIMLLPGTVYHYERGNATDAEKKVVTPRYDNVYFDAIEIMDKEDTLDLSDHPVLIAQNKEAFRKLYDDRQEILAILHSALRGGKERYKRALHEIMEICQKME